MTPGSEEFGYAAGFWTNRGAGNGARYRIAHGIPADAFMRVAHTANTLSSCPRSGWSSPASAPRSIGETTVMALLASSPT